MHMLVTKTWSHSHGLTCYNAVPAFLNIYSTEPKMDAHRSLCISVLPVYSLQSQTGSNSDALQWGLKKLRSMHLTEYYKQHTRMGYWYTQKPYAEWKRPVSKGYVLSDSIDVTFLNDKITGRENMLVVVGVGRMWMGVALKRQLEGFSWWWLFCVFTVMVDTQSTQVLEWHRTK